MRHAALFFAIALTGAGLDLLTKSLAFQHIRDYEEVRIIDGFFSYGKTRNQGVIFGVGQGARTLWLVISVAAVPAILAIFFSVKKPKWILSIALGMILAGTIGNMYDRISERAVRDFIKFYYRNDLGIEKVWPLFNLADAFICVGVFLLTLEMLFFEEKKKPAPATVTAAATPATTVSVNVIVEVTKKDDPLRPSGSSSDSS